MLITVHCPRCQTEYHLQESFLGKPMRCQNSSCQKVFLIEEKPSSTSTPARNPGQQTGIVGDLIPLLPVEPISPRTKANAPNFDPIPLQPINPVGGTSGEANDVGINLPDWESPPPVRKTHEESTGKKSSQTREKQLPQTSPTQMKGSEAPQVYTSGAWQAPPVRREQSESESRTWDQSSFSGEDQDTPTRNSNESKRSRESGSEVSYEEDHKPRGRWIHRIIVILVFLTVVGLSVGAVVVWTVLSKTEEELTAQAEALFSEGQYNAASQRYEQLEKRYPDSESKPTYAFRKELSSLLYRTVDPPEVITDILDEFGKFLSKHQKEPLLSKDASIVNDALIKLLVDYADREAARLKDDSALRTLEQAGPVIGMAKVVKLPKGSKPASWDRIDHAFAKVRVGIERLVRRRKIIESLEAITRQPNYNDLLVFEERVEDAGKEFPDLPASDQVVNLRNAMLDRHLKSIRYVKNPAKTTSANKGEETHPAILFDPLLRGDPGKAPTGDGIVFALARGILYALARSSGQIQWAVRVGVDTTSLPVRVPEQAGSAERVLVMSSDTSVLTAYATTGQPLWSYRVGTPVLGQPVVVKQRAYLPTYNGEVHEIELIEGKLLGRFLLNHRLTHGGIVEKGTDRVYFAADDGCVYVLNVANKTCERIVYTRHPAGSLRSPPILIAPEGENRSGFMILDQAVGLDTTRLRVFDLPLSEKAVERGVRPPPTLPGWTWFRPYHDAEKLVLLSDAGMLGLFGVRQTNTRDQALFNFLPGGPANLRNLVDPDNSTAKESRGRSEIVQVLGDNLWVLSSGRLTRLRFGWEPNTGPVLVPAWKDALAVGAPLHKSQSFVDSTGGTNLVVVTQPVGKSTVEVTAVDDESGKLKWKRQIGAVCVTEPVPVEVQPGEFLWLVCDQSGALFTLHPLDARRPLKGTTRWVIDPRNTLLAEGLQENLDSLPTVVPDPIEKVIRVFGYPDGGKTMVVREVRVGKEPGRLTVVTSRIKLGSRSVGTPCIVGSHLIIPLEAGWLGRVKLPLQGEDTELERGPSWRNDRAAENSPAFLAAVTKNRFVASDGERGLSVWTSPEDELLSVVPMNRVHPTFSFANRITAMEVLPPDAANLRKVIVADSAGVLHLIEVQADGTLVEKTSWELGTKITTMSIYPLKDEIRIGAILDQVSIAWISLTSKSPLWKWSTPGKDSLVGTPQLIDGNLLVADQSGFFSAVDLESGTSQGKGYLLKGSVAPMACPVPYGSGRLLIPLSDGSLLLLAKDHFRKGS